MQIKKINVKPDQLTNQMFLNLNFCNNFVFVFIYLFYFNFFVIFMLLLLLLLGGVLKFSLDSFMNLLF